MTHISLRLFVLLFLLSALTAEALAHHVLGRPSYSLNEDSNTPSSLQVEMQIGDFFINYMVFPAFPKPNEPGRVNLYVRPLDNGEPFKEKVTFIVRDNSWAAMFGLSANEEALGAQVIDDNVYRQGFQFRQAGDYIVTAKFHARGQPYTIDFPLTVGVPARFGPLTITAFLIVLLLIGVSLLQRRRAMTGKLRDASDDRHDAVIQSRRPGS